MVFIMLFVLPDGAITSIITPKNTTPTMLNNQLVTSHPHKSTHYKSYAKQIHKSQRKNNHNGINQHF